jgi:hypothetical protein
MSRKILAWDATWFIHRRSHGRETIFSQFSGIVAYGFARIPFCLDSYNGKLHGISITDIMQAAVSAHEKAHRIASLTHKLDARVNGVSSGLLRLAGPSVVWD